MKKEINQCFLSPTQEEVAIKGNFKIKITHTHTNTHRHTHIHAHIYLPFRVKLTVTRQQAFETVTQRLQFK